jgi:hypothetical protein
MGVREFFFLFEPFWLIYVTPFIAFIVSCAVLSLLYTRKRVLKDLPSFPLWMRVLISFIASGFVIVPLLLIYFAYEHSKNTDGIVFQIIEGWAMGVRRFFEFLGNFVPESSNYGPATPLHVLLMIGLGALYLSVLCAPVLLIIVGSLVVVFKRYTWKQKVRILIIAFVMGLLCSAFSISSALWLFDRLEEFNGQCQGVILETGNFKSHLTNLCNERSTFAECPKNEQELRAFNPEKYDALKNCTDSEYFFSEKYGQLWLVKKNHTEYYVWSAHKHIPSKDLPSYSYRSDDLKKLRQLYAE